MNAKELGVLTTRRQRVLMALVDEYVESAAPVGSMRIAQQYLREVSPATVRNELMGLETEGYAVSPHTSAGRVPTSAGYRVFVNTLLLRESLARESLAREALARETLMSETLIGEGLVSAGSSLDTEQRADRVLSFLSQATGLLCVLWRVHADIAVRRRGMTQLLVQPEFQDASALIPLMQLIEDDAALVQLLKTTLRGNGFMVKIGIEDEDGFLSSYSMVAEAYGDERPRGALAVFGPTRMDYRKVIPAVLLASRLLGHPRTRVLDW
jgi:transcriptional regulator of heat shock response